MGTLLDETAHKFNPGSPSLVPVFQIHPVQTPLYRLVAASQDLGNLPGTIIRMFFQNRQYLVSRCVMRLEMGVLVVITGHRLVLEDQHIVDVDDHEASVLQNSLVIPDDSFHHRLPFLERLRCLVLLTYIIWGAPDAQSNRPFPNLLHQVFRIATEDGILFQVTRHLAETFSANIAISLRRTTFMLVFGPIFLFRVIISESVDNQ